MAGNWGSAANTIQIGIFYDRIETSANGLQARIINPRVMIRRGVNITDTANVLTASGTAGDIAGTWRNISVSGKGDKTVRTLASNWINLTQGSPITISWTASLANIEYAGRTLTVSITINLPAGAINKPAQPALVNATATAISWTATATTAAPIESFIVRRGIYTGDGAAVKLEILTTTIGTARSVTIPAPPPNTASYLTVEAVNSVGYTRSTISTIIYTTPAAPKLGELVYDPAQPSLTATFTTNSPAIPVTYRVYYYIGGVLQAGYPKVASSPYTIPVTNSAGVSRVSITAVSPNSLESAASTWDNIVTNVAPKQPILTTPAREAQFYLNGLPLSWTYQHGGDYSPQYGAVAYLFQKGTDGTWTQYSSTIITGGTETTGLIQYNYFINRNTELAVEIEVSAANGLTARSNRITGLFNAYPPQVTLITPEATPEPGSWNWTEPKLDVTWTYNDTRPCVRWTIICEETTFNGTAHIPTGNILYTYSSTPEAAQNTAATIMLPEMKSFRLYICCWNSAGIMNTLIPTDFINAGLTYLKPNWPTLASAPIFQPLTGDGELHVVAYDDPVSGNPATEYIRVWRNGVLIGEYDSSDFTEIGPDPNGDPNVNGKLVVVYDKRPQIGVGVEYTIISYSDQWVACDPPVTFSTTYSTPFLYVNAGAEYQYIARAEYDVRPNRTITAPNDVIVYYANEERGVLFPGDTIIENIVVSFKVSGLGLRDQIGTYIEWEDLIGKGGRQVLYRDPLGRYITAAVKQVSVQHGGNTDLAQVTLTLEAISNDS